MRHQVLYFGMYRDKGIWLMEYMHDKSIENIRVKLRDLRRRLERYDR